jgi:tRNA G37 N-methylase TrmD
MGVLSLIGGILKPVTSLIDNLHTSDEEKITLHNELSSIENSFAERVLDYEAKITQMKADVIMTEAKGDSWLQRNWRPLTMLTFLTLIVAHYCGILAFEIADQMWTLLQIGIGGYIGSRGAEKIIPQIVNKLGGK